MGSRVRNQTSLLTVFGTMGVQAVACLCLAASLHAAPALETLLANMDTAASAWAGMRAEVRWVRYVSFVDDKSVESGRLVVRRSGSGDVEMLLEFEHPNHYFLAVRGAKVEIYKPKIKTVEEYNVSKFKEKLENALLLGFGTAGSYLREHYDIAVQGEESLAGQQTIRIDLRPKDPGSELNNRRLEMWISTSSWQPVQQKIYDITPGDYRLYSYSAIELNPTFSDREFKLRIPRGAQRVRPQR